MEKRIKSFLQLSVYRKTVILLCAAVISAVLVLVGGFYLKWLPGVNTAGTNTIHLLPDFPKVKYVTKVKGTPIGISIPSLNMSLPVINGYYNTGANTWTLTLDKAQYATISAPANNYSGNTFIYGHYRPEVFAYLHLIKPGSTATVTTSNGYKFNYQFIDTYAVSPEDVSVFSYRGAPILTIQTCSGAFFQNRQMYVFKFLGYNVG